ncbi:MAG: phosphatase PAP2 family protein [Planctomycetota bacterium]|nr:phosphatase PAP2 family protein [Planctomycetota bacterium]
MTAWAIRVLAFAVASYLWLDRPLAERVRVRPDWLGLWASRLTELAEAWIYLVFLVPVFAFCLWSRRKRLADAALLAWVGVAASGILVNVVKVILARARPKAYFSERHEYGFQFFRVGYEFNGFPSGHAATMGALAGALWIVWPRWRPVWVVVTVFFALTRVAAQAHFLSDVAVGYFLGAATSLVAASWCFPSGIRCGDGSGAARG